MSTTITSADFDLWEQGISPFQQQQSYLGAGVKPEQRTRQKKQFRKALAAEPDFIDFSEDRFLGLGSRVSEVTQETLTGLQIPVEVYSVRIRRGDADVDSKDLFPKFAIVRWGSNYRLLDLVLPERSG